MTAAKPAPPPSREIVSQLAPSGKLRAAINFGNVVLAREGGPRGATGPSVDIAGEVARRLGVPLEFVIYRAAGDVVSRLEQDKWDIGFMAVDPQRADQITFTAPYVYIEGTYLVRADAPFRSVADLDRSGIRIAVGKGAAYDLYLSRALKNAALVRASTSNEAIALFERDPAIDTVAGVRQALEEQTGRTQGYRVLPDAFTRIEQAVAIPRGREAALAWVAQVIEELKTDGFVRKALDNAGQQAARVADPAVR
ncbi:ABC transporter substrate-binding protein [Novosphingobium flavum]|uniref:ABC transporter substrate-binding protein n=1 Tax=Novosphingobium flavum TaxID=1778672 RepID=A0A7X1FTD3_9SPHN|nr:ABC transporter substrate-binding protein [Novosphingobium flavum]MBC2666122.1 ABC transporter substrate-binding protein [Novosphingobium flavum]